MLLECLFACLMCKLALIGLQSGLLTRSGITDRYLCIDRTFVYSQGICHILHLVSRCELAIKWNSVINSEFDSR